MDDVLNQIRHKLIVSCQGYDEKTFHSAEDMLHMANAAYLGGCAGFRLNSPDYIRLVKHNFPNVPIIGIWKRMYDDSEVYITPDEESVYALKEAGADIVALDCTFRKNHYDEFGWETVKKVKKKNPNIILMADCSTYDEAKAAVDAGVDIVSTTMSGYTSYSTSHEHPDFEMLKKCKENLDVFVICEGKIWTREDARKCFEYGADAIVVGTAITNPKMITRRFVDYLNEGK